MRASGTVERRVRRKTGNGIRCSAERNEELRFFVELALVMKWLDHQATRFPCMGNADRRS